MSELAVVEAGLGLTFRDKTLLLRALTHRSYINENPNSPLEDNERLEFLGDAVLDFVTGEYLYHRFPEMDEGQLTSLRSALVRTETLARFASEIGLDRFIYMGRGEEESGGRTRPAIMCGCYEALIGAFYLDQGAEAVAIKLGPDGAYYRTQLDQGFVAAVSVDKVVDTVGAGDGFAVGMISALLENLSFPEAVHRGNWIGSRAVQSRGDMEGLPTRTELPTRSVA